MSQGVWTDPARAKIRLADWTGVWLATKVDLRPTSRVRLEGILREHVLPEFGNVSLNRVSNSDVRKWVAGMLERGYSASTVRKAFNALSQIMRAAISDRRIVFNPCQDVPLPAERHSEQRYLSATDVEVLADSIEPRFRALVLLAAYGGLRFGELAGLRRSRVDSLRSRVAVAETLIEANGQLVIGPPKTKRSRRTVPLPRRVMRELENHLDKCVLSVPESLVFSGPKGGPLRRAGFRRSWWKPAVLAADLEGLKFHELRHSFVALWIAAGANPKEVSVRAGHSSVGFTLDRYGHLYEDLADEIPDRLDTLLTGQLASHTRPK
jgi:integrase